MEGTDSAAYRTIVLLDQNPARIREDWINIREDVAGITLIAFVIPFTRDRGESRFFKGIPIITWEDPQDEYRRAEQYCTLFKVTRAESLIVLGWEYLILYAHEEELQCMVTVHRHLYPIMSGVSLSRMIHRKLHGHFKKGEDGKIM